jgi:hypothetical protein
VTVSEPVLAKLVVRRLSQVQPVNRYPVAVVVLPFARHGREISASPAMLVSVGLPFWRAQMTGFSPLLAVNHRNRFPGVKVADPARAAV